MLYNSHLIPAVFESRLNRFLGKVNIKGETIYAFIPDPGRLQEILKPGSRVYLLKKDGLDRKTHYDLVQIDLGRIRVSTDSRLPNKIFEEALTLNLLSEFKGFRVEKREPVFEGSKLDFKLRNHGAFYVEVKSCTLVKNGVGLFPDAPTLRGSRQLKSLVKALEFGRSAIFFLVQREDVESLQPYSNMDPNFASSKGGFKMRSRSLCL